MRGEHYESYTTKILRREIPEGYSLKDFFRFDQDDEDTYGVLYSGERIDVNYSKPVNIEYKQSLMFRIWSGIKDILKGN